MADKLIGAGRQRQSSFKAAVRQFDTMNPGWPALGGPAPYSSDKQIAVGDAKFDLLAANPRQRHDDEQTGFGLQHIDRWLQPPSVGRNTSWRTRSVRESTDRDSDHMISLTVRGMMVVSYLFGRPCRRSRRGEPRGSTDRSRLLFRAIMLTP